MRLRLLWPASCLLLLTGCWSRVEINDRAFVTAIYLDRSEEGEYEVSLGFPLVNRMQTGGGLSQAAESQGNPFTIVTKKAESIPIAVRKIRSDLTREISFGHCNVIVVGKKMAESGINPILEFAMRQPDFHTNAYLMVASGKAKDVSYLTTVFERLPSEIIREFAKRRVTLDTNVKDFLEASALNGGMLAPMLVIGKTKMLSEQGKLSTWVGTDGAALFKDGKMIGTFDVKEMRAGLWVGGKMKNSMISIKSPTDGKIVSFVILYSKSKIRPVVTADQVRFDISIEAEDDIISSVSDIDINDPSQIAKLQEILSKELKGRIETAIKKSQSMKADVFGFARYLDWHYPKVWYKYGADWGEVYSRCEINVDARVAIKRTGTERNTIIRYQKD
nr:Ger(x)C family spore germination protein [Paenibacillus hamazuiensis]